MTFKELLEQKWIILASLCVGFLVFFVHDFIFGIGMSIGVVTFCLLSISDQLNEIMTFLEER